MNFGLRNRHMSSDAVPAIRTRPETEPISPRPPRPAPRQTSLRPTPQRALDQHHVARLEQLGDDRRRLAGVGDDLGLPVEALGDRGRQGPDGDQQVDAGRARDLAQLEVVVAAIRPQLEHVAEHGHAPRAAGARRWRRDRSRAARIDIGLAL